ncbi:MAG: ComEC/Rec2 family competence protein, partial [Synergistaceae bacterium]|nr:ComEC/Rec2 family competence protein [Synergistaceae bacterium]
MLANAPMLAVLGGVIAALALENYNLYLIFTAPVFTAAILICSFNNNNKFKIKGQAKIFLILILISLACSLRFYYKFNFNKFKSSYIDAVGTVRLVRPWGKTYRAVIDTQAGNFLITLHLPSLFPGELIKIQGETANFRNKNTFSELKFWRARDVQARLTRVKIQELGVNKFSFAYLRFKISNYLSLNMPKLTQAYLKAAWLGERDENINKFHRSLGTSHLLAVSGFHVGLAAFIAALIFGRKRVILISILLWLY